ncbi:integrase core domain-containing protein [Myxococcota bacterium]
MSTYPSRAARYPHGCKRSGSPNCNPYAERFVKTARTECVDHFVIFGERHLRVLVRESVAHYNAERFHQGLGSQLVRPSVAVSNDNSATGIIRCRSRLGGLLNFYHREAALRTAMNGRTLRHCHTS